MTRYSRWRALHTYNLRICLPFPTGYLMVRKNGAWGKLCLENFERVTSRASTTWTVTDLGQAVCQALTFRYVALPPFLSSSLCFC